MKKVYVALVLITIVFFTLPSPPPGGKGQGVKIIDSVAYKLQENINYIKSKLEESKEDLKFIQSLK